MVADRKARLATGLNNLTEAFVARHQWIAHAGEGRHRALPEELFRARGNAGVAHLNHDIACARSLQSDRAQIQGLGAREDDGMGVHELAAFLNRHGFRA